MLTVDIRFMYICYVGGERKNISIYLLRRKIADTMKRGMVLENSFDRNE